MAQVTASPKLARRSPVDVAIDRIWRFFCSVRAAVYEIVILALLVLIGTLRGSSVPNTLAEAAPALRPVVDRWYAWDVFHSLPFMAILATLAVAIAICTLNRAPAIWATIAHPTVATTRGFLDTAEHSATLAGPLSPAVAAEELGTALRRQRYRVLVERRGEETHLYADKNRYAKLGTFPFHLALILILVGGIVGARFGFRDTEFVLPDGATRAVEERDGLSVRLNRFQDVYREDGSPMMFRSDVTILQDGVPVKTALISPNHPLTIENVTFYQAGYGQTAQLEVTGPGGGPVVAEAVPLGLWQSAKNPDAPAGVLELPPLNAALHVIAPDQNPASRPELDDLQLRNGQLYVELRERGPDATAPIGVVVDQGRDVALGDLRLRFVRESRFTVLQVASNPGIPIFIAASLLLVGGLAITFYFPLRRVRGIIATAPGGGSLATLAPLAKRDWSGQRDFARLVEDLRTMPGITVTVRERPPAVGAAAYADGADVSPA